MVAWLQVWSWVRPVVYFKQERKCRPFCFTLCRLWTNELWPRCSKGHLSKATGPSISVPPPIALQGWTSHFKKLTAYPLFLWHRWIVLELVHCYKPDCIQKKSLPMIETFDKQLIILKPGLHQPNVVADIVDNNIMRKKVISFFYTNKFWHSCCSYQDRLNNIGGAIRQSNALGLLMQ